MLGYRIVMFFLHQQILVINLLLYKFTPRAISYIKPEWNRLETDESYLWPFIVYWLGLANYREEMETEIEEEEEEEED